MQSFFSLIFSVFLLCSISWGSPLENFSKTEKTFNDLGDSVSLDPLSYEVSGLQHSNDGIIKGYRSDENNLGPSNNSESTELIKLPNSTADNINESQVTEYSITGVKSEYSPSTPTTNRITEIFKNASYEQSSHGYSSSEPSTTIGGKSSVKSISTMTTSAKITESSTQPDDEPEGVVLGNPANATAAVPQTKTVYQRSLELITNTYTLSILLPVAAGVVFASTIIVMIATCRCLRRRCRHKRLRKKTLPDSVKNFRPSDRARLLAESSDEEF